MRLLQYDGAGRISFTKDLPKDGVPIPPYAILSHTWSSNDSDEVTFADIANGTATNKPGYDKISFCMRQSQIHGLQHFWVDTCCIDKTNGSELSKAINSMFRWYTDAEKCYVYLPDVSRSLIESSGQTFRDGWEDAFRHSRWFSRGWTLQELLAPKSVEFFSKEGEMLGSKRSLERQISDITGVPVEALRSTSFNTFTITERLSWQEKRFTKEEEDRYYSLLGIMDVSMSIIYGEGVEKARRRLLKEVQDSTKGTQSKDFSVVFSLTDVVGVDHFVARRDELEEMKRTLSGDGRRKCVVLHGLGGMGKTQLSIAYAVQYQHDYSAVFWLNIKDDDSVKSSFRMAAKQILRHHPSAERLSSIDVKGDIDTVVDAVKSWLSLPGNTRWLLIFDNYDHPKLQGRIDSEAVDIRRYLPEAHQGFIIITTRSLEVALGHRLPIRKLTNIQDSLSILASSSQRPDLMEDSGAEQLAQKLDGLPLALATAGAYLHQTPAVSCTEYLRYYENSWDKLQETSPRLMSYEDRTLNSTCQISFDSIEKQSAIAGNLLRLWAYFGNQDIWLELLRHSMTIDCSPKWLHELVTDELDFDRHVRVLYNHGFIEKESASEVGQESYGYSIHACLHLWTQTILNPTWDAELGKTALRCVALHVPDSRSQQWWITSRRLLSHATVCIHAFENGLIVDDGLDSECYSLGNLCMRLGKLDEAEKMYERALQGREKAHGPDHTSTLDVVNNLGILYANQGKLEKAEMMHKRALDGYSKALRPGHTWMLETISNLGNLYARQRKLEKAEKMYKRALQGYAEGVRPDHTLTLGSDSVLTLGIANNLGLLYVDQGKLEKAEKMYELVLKEKEKVFGSDHLSTLDTVNNFSIVYTKQGKLEKAEKMYERALQGYTKGLGPDNISTLHIVTSFGNLYAMQRKLEKAEEMYERALQGYTRGLGPDHELTLDIVNNFGILYADFGKLEEAEKMYEQALKGKEKVFGSDHMSTLDTVNNFAILYTSQEKLEKAEEMYERALQGREETYGLDHVSTLATVNNLGLLYAQQGKLKEAEKMFKRALGLKTVSALDTVINLAYLYARQGKLEEAEQTCERALQGYRSLPYTPQDRIDVVENKLSSIREEMHSGSPFHNSRSRSHVVTDIPQSSAESSGRGGRRDQARQWFTSKLSKFPQRR